MRTNPIVSTILAAGIIVGSATLALAQTTPSTTTTSANDVADNDDDGFNPGWLGLLGLIGLAGLTGRKRHDTLHTVDAAGRPRT